MAGASATIGAGMRSVAPAFDDAAVSAMLDTPASRSMADLVNPIDCMIPLESKYFKIFKLGVYSLYKQQHRILLGWVRQILQKGRP
jgi:hypothetical protein